MITGQQGSLRRLGKKRIEVKFFSHGIVGRAQNQETTYLEECRVLLVIPEAWQETEIAVAKRMEAR